MVEAGWLDLHYQASQEQYEAILKASGIQEGWQVLDAGAGSGSYLPLLSELVGPSGSICAVDLADENVDAMNALLKDTPLHCPVEITRGSILELPYDDDHFDAVWCANTMQYFHPDHWHSIIAELHRVLKPGGLIAIKEFDDVGLHIGPLDPALIWHLMEAVRDSELLLGAGALSTVKLPSFLRSKKFRKIRFESFVGDFQQPLSPVQREFLTSALALYADIAERAGLNEEDLQQWRKYVGDPGSDDYLLNSPDFYFREVHGLATGIK